MKIFDPVKAVASIHAIRETISRHARAVCSNEAELTGLDLTRFGIDLDAEDFSLARAERWTKRSRLQFRDEYVIFCGLSRSISVRLTNKRRMQRLLQLEHQSKVASR